MAEQTQCARCRTDIPEGNRKFVVIQEGQAGALICDECLASWEGLLNSQLWERIMFMVGVG